MTLLMRLPKGELQFPIKRFYKCIFYFILKDAAHIFSECLLWGNFLILHLHIAEWLLLGVYKTC